MAENAIWEFWLSTLSLEQVQVIDLCAWSAHSYSLWPLNCRTDMANTVCAFHPCRLPFPLRCHQDSEDTLTCYGQECWPLAVGNSQGWWSSSHKSVTCHREWLSEVLVVWRLTNPELGQKKNLTAPVVLLNGIAVAFHYFTVTIHWCVICNFMCVWLDDVAKR